MAISFTLHGLTGTDRLGHLVGAHFRPGMVIALNGPLGAGKSELARAMLRAACGELGDLPSPTFTLVQHYEMADGVPVWHMDLYRLNAPEEALALGIEDAFFEAVCLIEWPVRIADYLPSDCLHITIDFIEGASDERLVSLSGPDDILSSLASAETAGLLSRA